MKPTLPPRLVALPPKFVATAAIGCAALLTGGCTFTYARETVPPTAPGAFPAGSLPTELPTLPPTTAPTTPPPTTTTTTIPPTTAAPTTSTTAAPAPTTAAPPPTAAQTGVTVAARPPYEYDTPAIAFPLAINDALVTRVKDIGWEVDDKQDGAFKGSAEVAYFADTPNPEASPWVKVRTGSNARGVCSALGVPDGDPCEDAGVIYKGRWTLHTEKLGTGVRVSTNVSEDFAAAVMHSTTWGDNLIPKFDTSLLPPEMNTNQLYYVAAGLIGSADAVGAPAATLRLKKSTSSNPDLTISTLGVNMPLLPYRLDLDSDATVESVKVNGNDALLTNSGGDIKLVWNTDTGLKLVNAFKDQRAEAFLRSLIDR